MTPPIGPPGGTTEGPRYCIADMPCIPGTTRKLANLRLPVPHTLRRLLLPLRLPGGSEPKRPGEIWGQSIFLGVALTPGGQAEFLFSFSCFDFLSGKSCDGSLGSQ